MRTLFLALIFTFVSGHFLLAQKGVADIDILLFEPVIGDPVSVMLDNPTGFDQFWVNYDGDYVPGLCVLNAPTAYGWFIDSDFSVIDPDDTDNFAFTSCSYLFDENVRNDNWLILPPVEIPDSNYQLCWRSLITEGPATVDGYKVLASTSSNLPSSGDFSHVLFKAAETIKQISGPDYSLDPSDYLFSEGYVHASGFTDTNYYFLYSSTGPFRGRLEPHCVSLAEFAGQTIYVAFHHDSYNDTELQLDDILISNGNSVPVHQAEQILDFEITPNPAVTKTYINWNLAKPEAAKVQLFDLTGKLVFEKNFPANDQSQVFIDLHDFSKGVYQCVLQTSSGFASRKLVKL